MAGIGLRRRCRDRWSHPWVGEILQGNAAPTGIVFESWIHDPTATNLGGEPEMTVVPNLMYGPHGRWSYRLSGPVVRALARVWPLLLWTALTDIAPLAVGSVLFAGLLDVNVPMLFVYALVLAVAAVPLATLAGVGQPVAIQVGCSRRCQRRVINCRSAMSP
jgi:hypothetical protein